MAARVGITRRRFGAVGVAGVGGATGVARVAGAGGAAAIAAALGACSGPGDGAGAGAPRGGKVAGTLTYGLKGGTPPQLEAVEATVAAFQQRFPEVRVETDHFFGGDKNWLDVFLAKRAADSLPDTFGVIEYNQGIVWAYQGTLQPVDPFLKRDRAFKLEDFQQGPVNAYRAGGKLWGIPQTPNPVMIYYNRTQLEKSGQALPPTTGTPTSSWTPSGGRPPASAPTGWSGATPSTGAGR